MRTTNTFDITVLGQKIKIATDSDAEHINMVVSFVEKKFEEAKGSIKGINTQSLLIMTLLNVADELIKLRKNKAQELDNVISKMRRILEVIEYNDSQRA
ncbi:MAG: cell division protein ZapA [Deltaproteobacteria bacterium]|nr:cell division protein ZapA [Deltaproteobacteria bacterium]